MKFTQEKKRIQEKNRKQDTKGIKHDKDKLHLHLTLVKRRFYFQCWDFWTFRRAEDLIRINSSPAEVGGGWGKDLIRLKS